MYIYNKTPSPAKNTPEKMIPETDISKINLHIKTLWRCNTLPISNKYPAFWLIVSEIILLNHNDTYLFGFPPGGTSSSGAS